MINQAYGGSKGTHLTVERQLTQLPPLPANENPFGPNEPLTIADCTFNPTANSGANPGTVESGHDQPGVWREQGNTFDGGASTHPTAATTRKRKSLWPQRATDHCGLHLQPYSEQWRQPGRRQNSISSAGRNSRHPAKPGLRQLAGSVYESQHPERQLPSRTPLPGPRKSSFPAECRQFRVSRISGHSATQQRTAHRRTLLLL